MAGGISAVSTVSWITPTGVTGSAVLSNGTSVGVPPGSRLTYTLNTTTGVDSWSISHWSDNFTVNNLLLSGLAKQSLTTTLPVSGALATIEIQAAGTVGGRDIVTAYVVSRVAPTWRNILDFGGVGDGVTNNDSAISAALAAMPATGGTLYFPAGKYVFQTPITISNITNLTLRGDGCRFMQDFDNPPTQLLYTGQGTPAASDVAIKITSNFARNFKCEDLDVSYSNSSFIGSLIFVNLSPGATFRHCTLGGNGAGGGYLSSAATVIKIVGCENVTFHECLIQQATRCVWLPNTGALSTGTTIRDCQLGNITRAQVEVESGAAIGIIIEDSLLDNTSIVNPTYGLLISTNAFKIKGCRFAGSTSLSTPTNSCANLSGSGEFSNNVLLTSYPGVILNAGGTYHLVGNYGEGSPPLTILGGSITGGGNTWIGDVSDGMGGVTNYSPTVFVNTGANATIFDFGPDTHLALTNGVFTGNSINISPGGGATNTGGVIRYSFDFDQSTAGPAHVSGSDDQVSLRNLKFQSFSQRNCPVNGATGAYGNMGIFVLPARSLDQQGKGIRFRTWGTSTNAHVCSVKAVFGGTKIYENLNFTPSSNVAWFLLGEIYRDANGNQNCIVTGSSNGTVFVPVYTAGAESLSSDVTFTIQGGGAVANTDVVMCGFSVEAIQ